MAFPPSVSTRRPRRRRCPDAARRSLARVPTQPGAASGATRLVRRQIYTPSFTNWGAAVRVAPGCGGTRASSPRSSRGTRQYAQVLSVPTNLVNFGQAVNFPALLGITLAVFGAATLAHLLSSSASRRRREFALLKVLGFVQRQVRVSVSWQATTVAMVGIVVRRPARPRARQPRVAGVRVEPRRRPAHRGSRTALSCSSRAGVLVVGNLLALRPAALAARAHPGRRVARGVAPRRRYSPPRSSRGRGPLRAQHEVLCGDQDSPSPRSRAASASRASSVRSGLWWKSTTRRDSAAATEPDGVLGGGVAEEASVATSSAVSCASWISTSTLPASAIAASWYAPRPSSPGPSGRRAVVRHVGDRRAAVAHPVAVGPAALVGHLECGHREPLGLEGPRRDDLEAPRAPQPLGADREVRRRHAAREDVGGALAVLLVGQQQRDPRVVAVAALEEGQPVGVVPVQVRRAGSCR